MGNAVRIDIEVTENAAKATAAGERVRKPLVDAAGDIDRAFDKTSKQLANTLDKIEKDAWRSGKGMDDAFGTAMGGLRKSLELTREEAAQTGAGLHSSVGGSLREVQRNAEKLADSIKPVAQATVPINAAWEKTARLISTELDRVERDAWDAGRGTDRAFQTALASVRADFERVREAGRKTGATLESELGESLRAVKQDMVKLREEAEQTGDSLSESFSEVLSGGLSAEGIGGMLGGMAGWAAAGAAIGAAVWSGISTEWEQDRTGALIAAQTGSAANQAERLGSLTGDVFVSSFAGSLDEVSSAMTAAFNSKLIDTNAVDGEIERVTRKVMTLVTTTGDGAEEIGSAARALLVNGLAGNVTQALDMIQHASDVGLNYTKDLIDTTTEYSIHFKQLGLNGQEAFGLISQAAEGGVRNTDYAADALKEFGIRAQDMSAETRRGFSMIGLDADVMGRQIAAGGDAAKDALRRTLNNLQAMPSEIDRNSAAVALFGTKAEDLGESLYHMDLDNASDQFGDFAGAVEEAAQKLEGGMSGAEKFDKAMHNLKSSVGDFLGNLGSSDSMDQFEQSINKIQLAQEKWLASGDRSWLDELKNEFPELSGKIDDYIDKTQDEVAANNKVSESVEGQITTLDDLINKYNEAASGIIDLSSAQINNRQAIDAANEALAKNGATHDINTKAGQENQKALNDVAESTYSVIDAMVQQQKTSEEVAGFVQTQRDEYIRLATSMGMSAEEAAHMADQLGLIPGNYRAVVGIDVDYAEKRARDFKRLIDSIPDNKTVNLRVSTQGSGHHLAGLETGGTVGMGIWGAATGGQRHSSTLMNEAGPEVAVLPTGAYVATAGATRALAEAGAFNGGGGPSVISVSMAGGDDLTRAILRSLRFEILDSYGGSVQSALGARGVA